MAKIDLAYLLDLDKDKLSDYKFHAAAWNGNKHPLDDYIKDGVKEGDIGENWRGWQTW